MPLTIVRHRVHLCLALLVSVLPFFALAPVGPVIAADPSQASPIASPAALDAFGLPEIHITLTDAGYGGMPASLAAGRYHVVFEPSAVFGGGIGFVQPIGMSPNDYIAAQKAEVDAAMAAGGFPPLEVRQYMFQAVVVGSAFTLPGQRGEAIVDLTPGNWLLLTGDAGFDAQSSPFPFTVTGELSADLPVPITSATFTLDDATIEVTAGQAMAGEQWVAVTNTGQQPHFVVVFPGPDNMTFDQVQVMFTEEATAVAAGEEPTYSDLDRRADFPEPPVLISGTISPGVTMWAPLTIAPGTYLLACFFPDATDGAPHAHHGQYNLLTVE